MKKSQKSIIFFDSSITLTAGKTQTRSVAKVMERRRQNSDSKLSSGLTLMEVIMAIAVAIIIITAVYSSFVMGEKYYRKGTIKTELAQNGRVTLDRISREIRQTTEMVTVLPPDKSDPGNPPPDEIMFEDGHTLDIQYITYKKDGTDLKRKITHFYFSSSPSDWVTWNAEDEFGNSPSFSVDEEQTVAEYINQLQFYGEEIIYIDLTVQNKEEEIDFRTSAWERNL